MQEYIFEGNCVINTYDKWDDAVSVIFDSMNRNNMSIIVESDEYPEHYHIFSFNKDAKIICVDHYCSDGIDCRYNDLEKLNMDCMTQMNTKVLK